MYEKEIKVLNIDVDDIKRRLSKARAVQVKDEEQRNMIFKKGNSTIKFRRVMRNNDQYPTTKIQFYAIKKSTVKKNKEKNTKAKNEEIMIFNSRAEYIAAKELVEFLGYKLIFDGYKNRQSYSIGDYLFEIDEWNKAVYPTPYLEIEVNDPKLKVYDGLRLLWNEDEIKNLTLSKESIIDLSKKMNQQ